MAKERVLAVDDQEVARSLLESSALAADGYDVVVSEDAAQALQSVEKAAPTLVVLNGASPSLDGLGVLEALRERGIDAPALLLLPSDATRVDVRALQLGVSQVVVAPFDPPEVKEAIDRALHPMRLERSSAHAQERFQDQLEEQKRLYTIGQAIVRQTVLQQVCNRLLEAAVYVAGADGGYLFLRDLGSTEVRLRARLRHSQQTAEPMDQPVQDPLVEHVMRSGASQVLSDASLTPVNGSAPAAVDVPLGVREHATGVLRVFRLDEDNPFGAIDYHKLSVLASYAALAIENANMATSVQNAMEHTAICQISSFFASKLRLPEVLRMVMDVAASIVGADRGYIVLLDARSGQYEPRVTHAFGLDEIDELWFVPAKQIVHRVLAEQDSVAMVTERIPVEDQDDIPARAVLCVPMEGATNIIGAIYVERIDPERPFGEHHLSTLETLSVNAAMAIENAHLFDQVEAESRKLDAVLRGTEQPVIVTDIDGTVLLMNQAARRVFHTQGRKGTGLLFPRAVEHPDLAYLFEQARLSEQVQRSEITAGDEQTFSLTVTPISGVGVVAVMQDVTEIKKLSQLKTEFVSTVSHDLRSPLSAVQGFLSVLDQAGPVNEQQADFIASAQREITRLFDLTGDLLDLGRLESGIGLEMTRCDLKDVVEIAVVGWRSQAAKGELLLAWDLPPESVYVLGNTALLRRLVDNLVNNAIKYTLPGGQIEVELTVVGREAVLQVEDSGIGISAKDQPYVFDRFYRVRNEYTRDIEGTGLGLAIVRSIAERHDGRVWLESELGKGTTLGVVLPILEE